MNKKKLMLGKNSSDSDDEMYFLDLRFFEDFLILQLEYIYNTFFDRLLLSPEEVTFNNSSSMEISSLLFDIVLNLQ